MLLMMFDRDIEYVREKMRERERERDVCFWIQSRKRKSNSERCLLGPSYQCYEISILFVHLCHLQH